MGKDERFIEYIKDRPGHDRRYSIDWSEIRQELGWEPMHNFKEGLEKTIGWYTKNKEWWQRVKTGSYKEYYKKQYGNGDRHTH